MVDKNYCMSSFLIYRYVFNKSISFRDDLRCSVVNLDFERTPVNNADDLIFAMKVTIEDAAKKGKIALALSGGIDSAILARLVPEGTKAYTFRCIVPGKMVIDESNQAIEWARINKLDHEIIDIYWGDIDAVVDKLMLHKGAPIHSIEAQIYIAALKAKEAGIAQFIFGENADIIYGGMNGLLAKDWYYSEFVDRYMYVKPYDVLYNPVMVLDGFIKYENDGHIDGHEFINEYFRQEALGTYTNACSTAGVEFVGPYSLTYLNQPIDYSRIRGGDTKYIVREAFVKLYPGQSIPDKIPMPRPVNEWFEKWDGPKRKEFIPHCTDNMEGNQKWMVWALERFLNVIE